MWPMLLIYQEHGQSDFLRQCSEDSTIHDHLLAVMDPELAPAPWDPGRTLTPSSVSVYFISNQVPVQHEGRWCWLRDEGGRRLPKEWIKVASWARVGDLVRMRGTQWHIAHTKTKLSVRSFFAFRASGGLLLPSCRFCKENSDAFAVTLATLHRACGRTVSRPARGGEQFFLRNAHACVRPQRPAPPAHRVCAR